MNDNRIRHRLAPARRDSGLRIRGNYVWRSSLVHADGKWHAFDAPYRIVNPDLCPGVALEDPFFYKMGSECHLLVEDNVGKLTGKVRHGAHLVSENGKDFSLFEEEIEANSHTVPWQDGGETRLGRRERPWLVIQQGRPTHLVTGVLIGTQAWSLAQPLGDAKS